MKKRKVFHLFDGICILITAAVCILSIIAAVSSKAGIPVLVIDSPSGEYVYQLGTEQIVEIQGAAGLSLIHIRNGQASFEASPCTNKTCITSPPVSRNGDWSACLPNKIFIRIESENDDSGVDITAF